MEEATPVKFKEVPLLQHSLGGSKPREINIASGGFHNMLQDVKTSEFSGGFCFQEKDDQITDRFIYWRTYRESLFLTETYLHLNSTCHQVKITFEDSPILSVDVCTGESTAVMLVTTTTSFHRIAMEKPVTDVYLENEDSILRKLNEDVLNDSSNYYVFINDIGQSLPVAAAGYIAKDNLSNRSAHFAIATTASLYLFGMSETGEVKFLELEQNQLYITKLLSNLAETWRKKSHGNMTQVVSVIFGELEDRVLLYTLHHDSVIRIWSDMGRFLGIEYLVKYTQAHNYALRSSGTFIGFYFSFPTYSEFLIIHPTLSPDGNSVSLKTEVTILAPNFDMIDYKLSDRCIWSLWCNVEGEMQILSFPFANSSGVWLPVVLDTSVESDTRFFELGGDLRDIYSNRIFNSGKFSDNVISRALSMFNRSSKTMATSLSNSYLKRHVFAYVEGELQHERNVRNLDDEQSLELSNAIWEKFYQCCSQYAFEASRSIGLFLLEHTGVCGLVRKEYASFFRPCDELEVAFYSPIKFNVPAQGVQVLVGFLSEIENSLTSEQKADMDNVIHQQQSIDEFVLPTVLQSQLLTHGKIPVLLQSIHDLPGAIESFLRFLDPSQGTDLSNGELYDLCSGSISGEIISATTKQLIEVRYTMLRNFLLLQQILLNNVNLNSALLESLRSSYIPVTSTLLKCYHVMNWMAQARINSDWMKANKCNLLLHVNQCTSITLLQAFVSSYTVRSQNLDAVLQFTSSTSLLQKATKLISFICPSCDDFQFGEWLSDNELHVHIDEYVRLLGSWCERNGCSRNFIVAKSFLTLGDTMKAIDLFPLSVKGITSERLLRNFLKHPESNTLTPYEALNLFYLRVIRLFQNYGAYDCVMILVQSAIDSNFETHHQAMFQSIEFSSHIELSHYEEAYNSLAKNCESARKKDCLRQLICLMFAMRRLDILMELPYYGLEEEFQNIVHTNARSTEAVDCMQYDFLYSYFVKKNNLRKGALVAYEKAIRSFADCNLLENMQQYFHSLLKCVNSLSIIKPELSWILRPRQEDGRSESPSEQPPETNLEISDLKQLEIETVTACCVLQLSQCYDNFKWTNVDLNPAELIVMLTNEKLYHWALKLAYCSVPHLVPSIYESIVVSCLHSNTAESSNNWNWLTKNCASDTTGREGDSSTTAWNYLQQLLTNELIEPEQSYMAVLNQILTRAAYVPQWIKDWCFNKVPAKLIYCYLKHGRLEEAYDTTILLLETKFTSTLGEKFLFPVTVIDHLFLELQEKPGRGKETQIIEKYLRMIETRS